MIFWSVSRSGIWPSGIPVKFPGASGSASRLPAPLLPRPVCCCWTSLSPRWTRSSGSGCAGEIRALLDEWNIPVVLITHDPADVDAFADSLAVYRNGMIRHVLDDYPARRASEPDALSLLAPLVEV